jgi:hypothetical protein
LIDVLFYAVFHPERAGKCYHSGKKRDIFIFSFAKTVKAWYIRWTVFIVYNTGD